MPVITVRSDSDIEKIKAGDAYIIDVFPPATSESQEFDISAFAKRDELQAKIEAHLRGEKIEPDVTPKPEPRDCPGCTTIPATGLRWTDNIVKILVDTTLPRDYYRFYVDQINQLREFASEHSSLVVEEVNNKRSANVTITRGEIDGKGQTLGQTTYRFSGERMISAEIICDEADTGDDEEATKKHELGHALGIPHHQNRDALMYFASNGTAKGYGIYFAEDLRARYPKRFA